MPHHWLKLCNNDITCEDTVDSYICHCWPGYSGGVLCDTYIIECSLGEEVGNVLSHPQKINRDNIAVLPSSFNYLGVSGHVFICQSGFADRSLA